METTITVTEGSRAVVINAYGNRVTARLYVNARNDLLDATATTIYWKGKTVDGAKKWASKVLQS